MFGPTVFTAVVVWVTRLVIGLTVLTVVWLAMLPLLVTEVEPKTSLTERRPDWARMIVVLLTTCERRQLVDS